MFVQTVTRALSRLKLEVRGTAPLPKVAAPMLMHKATALVSSPDWTYEPKWDGFRVIALLRDGGVRLVSRNGHAFTHLFGPVSDALRGFPVPIVLDGEVICVTDDGRADFEGLQQRLRPREGKLPGHLCYMVFDCLYVHGHSLLGRPIEDRQAVLWELRPAPLHALRAPPERLTNLLVKGIEVGSEIGVVVVRGGASHDDVPAG